MVRLSFFAASALVPLAVAQIGSQSEIATSSAAGGGQPALSPPEAGCGGCYVVADVAGVVFGGVATQTITQITNIGTGPNGTAQTTQIVTQSASFSTPVTTDAFSFSPGGLINPTFMSTRYDLLDSTIIVSGATLTSPTQYEVFTAYSITSFSQGADGICSTIAGDPMVLSSAIEVAVPDNAPGNFLTQAEMSFIQALALTCAPGGGNVASTVQSMIEQSTTSTVSMSIIRPTPVPVTTAADTPSSTSTPTPTPTANATISTGMPIAPSFTQVTPSIMPGAADSVAPGLLGVGAAFGIGLAALIL